jgi:hypothetical protein
MAISRPDPKTKREVVDRLLSFDFDGDIRSIGREPATLKRTSEQSFAIHFPDSDRTYELSVHIPRMGDVAVKETVAHGPNRQAETRSFKPADGSVEREAWEEPLAPVRQTRRRSTQRENRATS